MSSRATFADWARNSLSQKGKGFYFDPKRCHPQRGQTVRPPPLQLKHVICAAASELGLHMALVRSLALDILMMTHITCWTFLPNSSFREPVNHLALPGGSRYGSSARRQDYAPWQQKCHVCSVRSGDVRIDRSIN